MNSPRLIAAAGGGVVWQWGGEAFGASAANDNPSGLGTFTYNPRFPGQYFDRETNLHYNTFRDYDPQTGRYVQSDPIGLDGGINTYSYANNQPTRYIDPTGEVALVDDAVIWGAVGVSVILMSPPGQKAMKDLAKGIADLCKKTDDDNKCKATMSREQAMAAAYAFAGISSTGAGANPIPWSNFNMPAGMGRGDKAYGDFMRRHYPANYGYSTPAGASVVEHPFGHPDLPGPEHHNCPHFHAKNAAGQEQIFPYKP